MNKPFYSFDSKCMELAEHFLPKDASKVKKHDLAQVIQDAVEDFCQMDEAGLDPVADGRHA